MSSMFEGRLGKFYLGDARELIKSLPNESVDAVITDPPWGVGFDEYDNVEVFYEVAPEIYRVLKPDSWFVFFFTAKRVLELNQLLKYFEYRWLMPYLFWSFGTVSRNPIGSQASYGIVMVFSKGKPKVKVARKDVLISDELPVVVENIRESQFKPTYTVSVLLTMFTKENDFVLDPFAGYGSIPLVCELFNRRWLAFEIDPIKYEIAKKLISERRVLNISKLKKELQEKIKKEKSGKSITEFLKPK